MASAPVQHKLSTKGTYWLTGRDQSGNILWSRVSNFSEDSRNSDVFSCRYIVISDIGKPDRGGKCEQIIELDPGMEACLRSWVESQAPAKCRNLEILDFGNWKGDTKRYALKGAIQSLDRDIASSNAPVYHASIYALAAAELNVRVDGISKEQALDHVEQRMNRHRQRGWRKMHQAKIDLFIQQLSDFKDGDGLEGVRERLITDTATGDNASASSHTSPEKWLCDHLIQLANEYKTIIDRSATNARTIAQQTVLDLEDRADQLFAEWETAVKVSQAIGDQPMHESYWPAKCEAAMAHKRLREFEEKSLVSSRYFSGRLTLRGLVVYADDRARAGRECLAERVPGGQVNQNFQLYGEMLRFPWARR